jgi:ribosomal-protein-alanine N-acetyltransferase
MNNEFLLRDYKMTDLDAMFRLDEACFTEEFRFDRESMREFAEEGEAIVRVAEKASGEIAGFVIVHIERVASEVRAYVVTLDVAPECRQMGLASQLMREAEARAAATGVGWIQLHVFTKNEGAVRFYEQLGYQRTGTRRGFYGAPRLDAFVYGKGLPYL